MHTHAHCARSDQEQKRKRKEARHKSKDLRWVKWKGSYSVTVNTMGADQVTCWCECVRVSHHDTARVWLGLVLLTSESIVLLSGTPRVCCRWHDRLHAEELKVTAAGSYSSLSWKPPPGNHWWQCAKPRGKLPWSPSNGAGTLLLLMTFWKFWKVSTWLPVSRE